MEVHLTPEQEAFIDQAVSKGRFASAEDAMREAVKLLGVRELELTQMRAFVHEEFKDCVDTWRKETGHLSSIERKAMHPAYQRIMAMGKPALPFVLRELQEHGGHWFWALHFLAGETPIEEGASVTQAKEAWLLWGRQKGYI